MDRFSIEVIIFEGFGKRNSGQIEANLFGFLEDLGTEFRNCDHIIRGLLELHWKKIFLSIGLPFSLPYFFPSLPSSLPSLKFD